MLKEARMPFGKHGGKLLKEVPAEYLKWLLTLDYPGNWLRLAIQREMLFRRWSEGLDRRVEVFNPPDDGEER